MDIFLLIIDIHSYSVSFPLKPYNNLLFKWVWSQLDDKPSSEPMMTNVNAMPRGH